ncbi:hypothetical protein JTB14_008736 [Gonioctena quinquepunctata]|nr:hypothetical protein JTB14_008736 [Gonioctena quinquepunctata]
MVIGGIVHMDIGILKNLEWHVLLESQRKQMLFLGVRNKYCSICSISKRKNEVIPFHKCYKNWPGSFPAMDANIIVEGSLHSESLQTLQYTAFISDEDSNVHSKTLAIVPYSLEMRKIECANHLIENVTKHLHELSKESSVQNKLLPSNRITHIGKTYRKLITLHSELPEPCAFT